MTDIVFVSAFAHVKTPVFLNKRDIAKLEVIVVFKGY